MHFGILRFFERGSDNGLHDTEMHFGILRFFERGSDNGLHDTVKGS